MAINQCSECGNSSICATFENDFEGDSDHDDLTGVTVGICKKCLDYWKKTIGYSDDETEGETDETSNEQDSNEDETVSPSQDRFSFTNTLISLIIAYAFFKIILKW